MTIFPIRTFGDPVLRAKAEPVEIFDDALHRLAKDMIETMRNAPGVGLAAPQIGIPKRICVFDAGQGAHILINPEIVETSDEWEFDEGCLSLPGRNWPILRPSHARVVGVDVHGEPLEYEGDELLGRVLQHEVDHLNGILLIERLAKSVRKMALRDLRNEALGLAQ